MRDQRRLFGMITNIAARATGLDVRASNLTTAQRVDDDFARRFLRDTDITWGTPIVINAEQQN